VSRDHVGHNADVVARSHKLQALKERQTHAEQFVFVMTRPLRAGFFGRLRWLLFGLPKDWNAHVDGH
jgi:hypothetical protein